MFARIFSFFLISAAILEPQSAQRFEPPSWYALGMEQGLAGSTVDTILQDRRGLLWFGGESGVSRYDGHAFEVATASGPGGLRGTPPAVDLAEDSEGRLWSLFLDGSLAWIDQDSASLDMVRGLAGEGRATSLAADRQDRLLVGDSRGSLWRRGSGGEWRRLAVLGDGSEPLSRLAVDARGRIWVATRGAGLFLLEEV